MKSTKSQTAQAAAPPAILSVPPFDSMNMKELNKYGREARKAVSNLIRDNRPVIKPTRYRKPKVVAHDANKLAHQEPMQAVSEWQEYNDADGAESVAHERDLQAILQKHNT